MTSLGLCCKLFLIIIIALFSNLYPMLEIDSQQDPFSPLTAILDFHETVPRLLDSPALFTVDASTQTEEAQPQSLQPITNQSEPALKTLKLEPYINFLGGKYVFTLLEDLASAITTRRTFIYDMWRNSQDKLDPLYKRLIIFFEDAGDGKISVVVFCFDFIQKAANGSDISHQILNTTLQQPYPSLRTLVRRILANELITILVLLNQDSDIVCKRCSNPICTRDHKWLSLPSDGLLLLSCMEIYHLDCARMDPSVIPANEDDYVIYQKQT